MRVEKYKSKNKKVHVKLATYTDNQYIDKLIRSRLVNGKSAAFTKAYKNVAGFRKKYFEAKADLKEFQRAFARYDRVIATRKSNLSIRKLTKVDIMKKIANLNQTEALRKWISAYYGKAHSKKFADSADYRKYMRESVKLMSRQELLQRKADIVRNLKNIGNVKTNIDANDINNIQPLDQGADYGYVDISTNQIVYHDAVEEYINDMKNEVSDLKAQLEDPDENNKEEIEAKIKEYEDLISQYESL